MEELANSTDVFDDYSAKEAALRDERTAEAAMQMRRHRLETLIAKRRTNFAYLKRIHEGNSFWLNSVAMPVSNIRKFAAESGGPPDRLLSFFYLGLSLGKILEHGIGFEVVKESLKLFEEWEYYFASFSVQSVKYVMASTVSSAFPDAEFDINRQTINKFNNDVIFERLTCPHVGFDFDHVEVVRSLCDMLSSLYEKMWADMSYRYV